jgi:hypothetical protein
MARPPDPPLTAEQVEDKLRRDAGFVVAERPRHGPAFWRLAGHWQLWTDEAALELAQARRRAALAELERVHHGRK